MKILYVFLLANLVKQQTLSKQKGATTLAISNIIGSSITREADYTIYTHAGPEIAVASTKAYSSQVVLLAILAIYFAEVLNSTPENVLENLKSEILDLPVKISNILDNTEEIKKFAKKVYIEKDMFFLGRGTDYNVALEGSLKLKEISYIHSEAYAAGELKHGPIALITTNTPVVATVTQEKLMSKELSNIKEVKSRGADIVLFIKEALSGDLDNEYRVIRLPDMQDEFMVLPASVALQLLAYYVSSDKGFDVDKPRNLAKVVTVE